MHIMIKNSITVVVILMKLWLPQILGCEPWRIYELSALQESLLRLASELSEDKPRNQIWSRTNDLWPINVWYVNFGDIETENVCISIIVVWDDDTFPYIILRLKFFALSNSAVYVMLWFISIKSQALHCEKLSKCVDQTKIKASLLIFCPNLILSTL